MSKNIVHVVTHAIYQLSGVYPTGVTLHKKWSFPLGFFQFPADLVTFTEEILHVKLLVYAVLSKKTKIEDKNLNKF